MKHDDHLFYVAIYLIFVVIIILALCGMAYFEYLIVKEL
jgi:hypothetical protein